MKKNSEVSQEIKTLIDLRGALSIKMFNQRLGLSLIKKLQPVILFLFGYDRFDYFIDMVNLKSEELNNELDRINDRVDFIKSQEDIKSNLCPGCENWVKCCYGGCESKKEFNFFNFFKNAKP